VGSDCYHVFLIPFSELLLQSFTSVDGIPTYRNELRFGGGSVLLINDENMEMPGSGSVAKKVKLKADKCDMS
ncbi:hypothetical protein Tco_0049964, partial [Tanacetum coccineum]